MAGGDAKCEMARLVSELAHSPDVSALDTQDVTKDAHSCKLDLETFIAEADAYRISTDFGADRTRLHMLTEAFDHAYRHC